MAKKKSPTKPNDDGLFVVINISTRYYNTVPKDKNPTKLHFSLLDAENEAGRLAKLNVGQRFAIFHCVGIVQATAPVIEITQPTKADKTHDQDLASIWP